MHPIASIAWRFFIAASPRPKHTDSKPLWRPGTTYVHRIDLSLTQGIRRGLSDTKNKKLTDMIGGKNGINSQERGLLRTIRSQGEYDRWKIAPTENDGVANSR